MRLSTTLVSPALLALAALSCATTEAKRAEPAAQPGAPSPAGDTLPPLEEDTRTDPLQPPADVAAPPADAQVSAGGLASKLLRRGTGSVHPTTFSTVRVHYTGWTTDGKMFDSSVARGAPAEFPLNGVILGWRYGLKQMVVGEKRRLWIPEELAYKGQQGPQGMLVFDVELLDIVQQ